MSVRRIERHDDPRIADYHGVADPELLRSRGLFVAEGRLVVARVVDDPRYTVHSVLVSPAAHRSLQFALEKVDASVPIYVCDLNHFRDIAGYNVHRGCLALVECPAPVVLEDIVRSARLLVVLDGVANADNVGGVFRNAAAFGVDAVVLSPTCCDPFYRKAIRTSMAATLRVPFARVSDWPGALSRIRAAGLSIVALTPREPSETLAAWVARGRPPRLAVIVGAEGAGLSPAVEASADYRVRIPIQPEVDSLNLAVAAGIALHGLTTN